MNGIKSLCIKLLIALLVVAAILTVIGAGIYKRLVAGEQAVCATFTSIDLLLQQRNELIPSLTSTIEEYAPQEKETVAQVEKTRTLMMQADSMDDKIAADGALSMALLQLQEVGESYPALQTDEQFVTQQAELLETENRIIQARINYNHTAMDYNRKLRSFPSNLVARLADFRSYNAFTTISEDFDT